MQHTAQVRSPSRAAGRRAVPNPLPSSDRARRERSRRVNAVAQALARVRAMHRGRV